MSMQAVRKFFKIFLFTILAIGLTIAVFLLYATSISPNAVVFQKDKLNKINQNLVINDTYGNEMEDTLFTKNSIPVKFATLKDYTKDAFVVTEDKRFYEHNGIDPKRMAGAILKNLKSFSLKEGASTISQQLIKNSHLSNEKSFTRKLNEMKLSLILENNYTKDEILEMYLNITYLGEGNYGIQAASQHYYHIDAIDLNKQQSEVLVKTLKRPSIYNPSKIN